MLLLGFCIGGGILALPMATAPAGFWSSSLLLLACWALMTFTAFLVLEANMWFSEHSNLITMAKSTLGPWGQLAAWLSYALLLYSIMCAYLSGTTDVVHHFLDKKFSDSTMIGHFILHYSSVIVTFVLGSVIYFGVAVVDYVNRSILSVKLILLAAIIAIVFPHANTYWPDEHPSKLVSAAMVVVSAFGYSTLVPTLRYYFKSNIKMLRIAVLLGSFIPLMFYLSWDFVIHTSIQGIGNIAPADNTITYLTTALIAVVQKPSVNIIIHTFTSICVFTSFLGGGLCLVDFLSDGLGIKKVGLRKAWLHVLTLGPPLLIVWHYPDIFVKALNYAGITCVVLLILLPTLMVWRGRYVKKYASTYQVMGGKFALILSFVLSLILLGIAIHSL